MENSSPSPNADNLEIQQTEKQLWEIVKSIPSLNVTYGTVRCIVYVVKKDRKEYTDSAVGVAKGAIQTAVISAGVFAAPVTIPIAAGVLTGVVAKSVSDTVEILVFFVTNTEELKSKTSDQKEQAIYDKIKNVSGVGALYSAVRVPVYLFKKNKQQSVESGVNLVANSGGTAVQIGVSMIPNIDEQIQKLVEKTARHAIKLLAKKVLDQVSRNKLQLEHGIATINHAENDCQAIIDVTSVSTEEIPVQAQPCPPNDVRCKSSSLKDNTNCNVDKIEKQDEDVKQKKISCCWCFRKRRRSRTKTKVEETSAARTDGNFELTDKLQSDNDLNSGQLIIITE